ncbi:sulfotransferase domain-containing protein [Flavobacteriaceae bacterium]|nr:sulfotransferase domain-containing protein [Flavobacteriaceae bacterium]
MKYFFITSLGRSGTKFFASMLNKSSEVMCFHEPYREDYVNLLLSYYAGDLKALETNLQERFKDVERKISGNSSCNYYGEVNSLLRYNTIWLKENLNAKVAHVVRDPKKVVPSIYSRNVYKEGGSHLEIVPNNANAYASQWLKMSRFEKICWYWTHTNNRLSDDLERCFKFEDLISDYSKFQELINYLEIPMLSESVWKTEVSKPKNTSKTAIFRVKAKSMLQFKESDVELIGGYNEWTEDMKKSFNAICGDTAKKMGYGI